MANPRNTVTIIGNLAAAPRFFTNNDKSRSAKLTVYARNNYSTNGEYRSTAIDCARFIPAENETNGIYDNLVAGQMVAITGHIESYVINEKRLERVIDKGTTTILEKEVKVYKMQVAIDNIEPLESADAAKARKDSRATQTQDQKGHQAESAAAPAQAQQNVAAEAAASQDQIPAPHEASNNPPF